MTPSGLNQCAGSSNRPANLDFPLIASFMAFDPTDNLAYITNTASNTISVIDGDTDSVIDGGMTFDSTPPGAGNFECNGMKRLSGNSTLYNKGEVLQCVSHFQSVDTF